MEQTERKRHHIFLKTLAVIIILAFFAFYAYSFPKTMELLDKKANELLDFAGLDFEFSLFSNFSVFVNESVNQAQYYYEIIKGNFDETFPDTEALPVVIFSCASEFPLENRNITSAFGERADPISGKGDLHTGMDIAADFGSEITAAWSGNVFETGVDEIYGKYIILKHSDGFFSKYCHLSKIEVSENDFVNAKEKIGEAGSTGRTTGSHLHFEVEVDGRKIDPMECFEF